MRRRYRPKYQLPGSRGRRRNWVPWVAVTLGLGWVAWFVWRPGHGSGPTRSTVRTPVQTAEKSLRSATNDSQVTPFPTRARVASGAQGQPRVVRSTPPDGVEIRNQPPLEAERFPRPAQNVFEAQVALARQGICPGSLDGVLGPQSRAAVAAFQRREHLPPSGDLDPATLVRLVLTSPATSLYSVTAEDLGRLQPLSPTWVGRSQQSALDYETVLELVAERGQAHPRLIRRLNPDVDWDHVAPGTAVRLPEVSYAEPSAKAAFIVVRLDDKVLEAFSSETNLLAHFPCSIARAVEKRPVGQLHVVVIAPNPNYTFDPVIFPESAEARTLNAKLILPAGPNNPVGVAWIGLDKPGYGIHGTPNPEQVGRSESHGCFRLANWNAQYLIKLTWIGMPVYVER